MKRKYVVTMIAVPICAVIFYMSYDWSLDNTSKTSLRSSDRIIISQRNVELNESGRVLPGNITVVLKLNVSTTDRSFILDKLKLEDMSIQKKGQTTVKDIVDYFKEDSYKFESLSENELVLVKSGKYEPGKYYLGDRDGLLVIYKCNDNGELFIEDEEYHVSGRSFESLSDGDKEFIKECRYMFGSREEAEEEMAAMSS